MLQAVFVQPENTYALTILCEALEISMTEFLRKLIEYIALYLYIF
jgi:hypothetical protein